MASVRKLVGAAVLSAMARGSHGSIDEVKDKVEKKLGKPIENMVSFSVQVSQQRNILLGALKITVPGGFGRLGNDNIALIESKLVGKLVQRRIEKLQQAARKAA